MPFEISSSGGRRGAVSISESRSDGKAWVAITQARDTTFTITAGLAHQPH